MLDEYMTRLMRTDPDVPLEGLEADVWVAIESSERKRRAYRVIASWQFAAMAAILVDSAGVGAATAVSARAQPRGIDHAAYDLAPSTLLLGRDSS
jgi:hypothetical protein